MLLYYKLSIKTDNFMGLSSQNEITHTCFIFLHSSSVVIVACFYSSQSSNIGCGLVSNSISLNNYKHNFWKQASKLTLFILVCFDSLLTPDK